MKKLKGLQGGWPYFKHIKGLQPTKSSRIYQCGPKGKGKERRVLKERVNSKKTKEELMGSVLKGANWHVLR